MFRELSKALLRKKWTPILQPVAGFNRKARWHPVAKSRYYYIPKRPDIPEEEWRELKRLYDNYHTQMRAFHRYYYEKKLIDKHSQLDVRSQEYQELQDLDFERCKKINDEWNVERAKDREARMQKVHEQMLERALTIMEVKDRKQKESIARANELIRKEKEASKTFITCEAELDAAIEQALANITDYNFSIDLNGNKYMGREANSSIAKSEGEAIAAN